MTRPKHKDKIKALGNISKCHWLCIRANAWFCGYSILEGRKYLPLANIRITDIPINPYECLPDKCDYFKDPEQCHDN
ncbi:MAG TPA: hypothetical protein VN368_02910 [Candidatus Methylomirabilis sp.]|nr:hypothetical protein [Candidatus Methylomirabilis sp.]